MSSCSNQAPQGQATIPMTAAMQNKVLTQNLKDVRHKLFVMSGKGGVAVSYSGHSHQSVPRLGR